MPQYQVTSTFLDSTISAKKYALIWRTIIERSEKNHVKDIDNDRSDMV